MENLVHLLLHCDLHLWTQSILCCGLVSLAGVLPYFVFNSPKQETKNKGVNALPIISPKNLDYLLNFAIGSLLGDTFLHLLPESWEKSRQYGKTHDNTGLWILIGIISFVICEKLALFGENEEEPSSTNNNISKTIDIDPKPCQKDVMSGYFNLIANGFDNFTHGLAVGGSFLISTKIGYLTTIAILLHEIPHEISDFAILLRSGFNPMSAVKAQLWTSCFGFLGAICALIPNEFEDGKGFLYSTNWILPFTSGCFISIALINLLPEQLTKEGGTGKDSLKQLLSLLLGITVMGLVSMCHL